MRHSLLISWPIAINKHSLSFLFKKSETFQLIRSNNPLTEWEVCLFFSVRDPTLSFTDLFFMICSIYHMETKAWRGDLALHHTHKLAPRNKERSDFSEKLLRNLGVCDLNTGGIVFCENKGVVSYWLILVLKLINVGHPVCDFKMPPSVALSVI